MQPYGRSVTLGGVDKASKPLPTIKNVMTARMALQLEPVRMMMPASFWKTAKNSVERWRGNRAGEQETGKRLAAALRHADQDRRRGLIGNGGGVGGTGSDSEQSGKSINPDNHHLRLICLVVVAVASCVFVVKAPAASDQEPTATVNQDMERLACLDAIANPTGRGAPVEVTSDERSKIIAGCLSQMGEFGTAMTRACVEQDLAAYEALLAYPEPCASLVVRCAKQLGQHGWGTVKICVDKGIESERATAD